MRVRTKPELEFTGHQKLTGYIDTNKLTDTVRNKIDLDIDAILQ